MEEEEWVTVGKEKKPKPKPKKIEKKKESAKDDKKLVGDIPKRDVVPLPHEPNKSYSTPDRSGSPLFEYDKETLQKMLEELGDDSKYLPPPVLKEKKRIQLLLDRIKRKEEQQKELIENTSAQSNQDIQLGAGSSVDNVSTEQIDTSPSNTSNLLQQNSNTLIIIVTLLVVLLSTSIIYIQYFG